VTEDSLAIRRHLDGLVVRIAALARRHGNITLLDFVDPPSEAGDRFETCSSGNSRRPAGSDPSR
jgi:hypothetical protein